MKLCPICNVLIPYANRYCDACAKIQAERHADSNRHYDKGKRKSEDNKLYDSFYHSSLWLKVRMVVVVRDHALCMDCLKNNIVPLPLYHTVHHIIPIKNDYNKRLDINNLICLCEACHQRRHRELKGAGVG